MPAPDDRIPLRFGPAAAAGPQDALLIEGGAAVPANCAAVARFGASVPHRPGCACCAGRGAAATALGALFQDRARGRVAWFTAVVAAAADPAALAAELRADLFAAARFRIAGQNS